MADMEEINYEIKPCVRWTQKETLHAHSNSGKSGEKNILSRRTTILHIRSDNKVRELATVCLPRQQWTETSVRLDDVGISAFHSCVVVVDVWQSHSKWRLWSWTLLLLSDTNRKPTSSITVVYLPFVSYVLTLPYSYEYSCDSCFEICECTTSKCLGKG
jgi:hypothetical protein